MEGIKGDYFLRDHYNADAGDPGDGSGYAGKPCDEDEEESSYHLLSAQRAFGICCIFYCKICIYTVQRSRQWCASFYRAYCCGCGTAVAAGSESCVDHDFCHDRVVDDRFQYAFVPLCFAGYFF